MKRAKGVNCEQLAAANWMLLTTGDDDDDMIVKSQMGSACLVFVCLVLLWIGIQLVSAVVNCHYTTSQALFDLHWCDLHTNCQTAILKQPKREREGRNWKSSTPVTKSLMSPKCKLIEVIISIVEIHLERESVSGAFSEKEKVEATANHCKSIWWSIWQCSLSVPLCSWMKTMATAVLFRQSNPFHLVLVRASFDSLWMHCASTARTLSIVWSTGGKSTLPLLCCCPSCLPVCCLSRASLLFPGPCHICISGH